MNTPTIANFSKPDPAYRYFVFVENRTTKELFPC